ncbi:cytochrome b [Shewanella sedimentimangrovi]|uniref:Cytochrome b n=1 Tax=Shewanella sedimentimangrovi TaxID=2814293 RepID=A0ABX7R2Q9_9GAMM|nr:cytochrome b [Shewanella sedimentimangrovi]QSX38102.1 cytochrome b [Shewanella sedimentimangrovi]
MWHNNDQSYGWIAIGLHWLSAGLVLGLFALGLWMVDLNYYSNWYKTAPHWHKSLGLALLLLTLLRLLWRWLQTKPAPLAAHSALEARIGRLVHGVIYLLMLLIMCSGYLISTADGRGIAVFNLFELPALPWQIPNQEDRAGELHALAAWSLMAMVGLHLLGALKHQFIDRDLTLKRILTPIKENYR